VTDTTNTDPKQLPGHSCKTNILKIGVVVCQFDQGLDFHDCLPLPIDWTLQLQQVMPHFVGLFAVSFPLVPLFPISSRLFGHCFCHNEVTIWETMWHSDFFWFDSRFKAGIMINKESQWTKKRIKTLIKLIDLFKRLEFEALSTPFYRNNASWTFSCISWLTLELFEKSAGKQDWIMKSSFWLGIYETPMNRNIQHDTMKHQVSWSNVHHRPRDWQKPAKHTQSWAGAKQRIVLK
jgi:hypothetical protein